MELEVEVEGDKFEIANPDKVRKVRDMLTLVRNGNAFLVDKHTRSAH